MPSHSFLRRSSSQRTPSRKTSNKKATQKIEWLSSDFRFCGSWGIRTPDPLLVRQTLWTSWAKLPLKMARDCKGNHYFSFLQIFQKIHKKKISAPLSQTTFRNLRASRPFPIRDSTRCKYKDFLRNNAQQPLFFNEPTKIQPDHLLFQLFLRLLLLLSIVLFF